MQLVGELCKECGQPIKFLVDAVYCRECDMQFHKQCIPNGTHCPQCGRDITGDLQEVEAKEEQVSRRNYIPGWVKFSWGAPLACVAESIIGFFVIAAIIGLSEQQAQRTFTRDREVQSSAKAIAKKRHALAEKQKATLSRQSANLALESHFTDRKNLELAQSARARSERASAEMSERERKMKELDWKAEALRNRVERRKKSILSQGGSFAFAGGVIVLVTVATTYLFGFVTALLALRRAIVLQSKPCRMHALVGLGLSVCLPVIVFVLLQFI